MKPRDKVYKKKKSPSGGGKRLLSERKHILRGQDAKSTKGDGGKGGGGKRHSGGDKSMRGYKRGAAKVNWAKHGWARPKAREPVRGWGKTKGFSAKTLLPYATQKAWKIPGARSRGSDRALQVADGRSRTLSRKRVGRDLCRVPPRGANTHVFGKLKRALSVYRTYTVGP